MNRLIIIPMLLWCGVAQAGDFVFHTGEVITGKRSSCGAICSQRPDALLVDKVTYDSITRWSKVVNDEVVEMTQEEKDVILAAKAQAAIDAETARINSLDDEIVSTKTIRLNKVETAIDNIGNLEDAKVFLKRLVRYIASQ